MNTPAKPTPLDLRDLPVWRGLLTFASHDGLVETPTVCLAVELQMRPAAIEAALDRIETLGLIERVEGGVRVESYREYHGPRRAGRSRENDEDIPNGTA